MNKSKEKPGKAMNEESVGREPSGAFRTEEKMLISLDTMSEGES